MSALDLLTTSRLKDARACQRKHRLRYRDGIRPATTADALRFGELIHGGLEAWWTDDAAHRLDSAVRAVKDAADPFDRVKAETLLRAYDLRWGDEPYDVLAVELEFSVPLVNPETDKPSRTWRLAGKIDAVVRDRRDGRVLIVEHKTSSENISPGSEYWRRLRMDGQVSVYYAGARGLGYDVAGCLYDVIGKPGIRPLKVNGRRAADETPEEYGRRLVQDIIEDPTGYFARGEVVRLESEMAEAMHDIWQTAQQIREAERAGKAPRNPDACVSFGRTCPYFALCTGEASADDASLYTISNVTHPELSTAIQAKAESNAA